MKFTPSDLIAAADRLESHYEGHIATGPMLRAGAEAIRRVDMLHAYLNTVPDGSVGPEVIDAICGIAHGRADIHALQETQP